MCWLFLILRASNSWNPLGLSRPVMGLLYLYTYYWCMKHETYQSTEISLPFLCFQSEDGWMWMGEICHMFTQHLKCTHAIWCPIWWGKVSQKHNNKYMAKWWCLLAMEKLHVSAYSGNLQVLTTFLLKEFYIICLNRVVMLRSLILYASLKLNLVGCLLG